MLGLVEGCTIGFFLSFFFELEDLGLICLRASADKLLPAACGARCCAAGGGGVGATWYTVVVLLQTPPNFGALTD